MEIISEQNFISGHSVYKEHNLDELRYQSINCFDDRADI